MNNDNNDGKTRLRPVIYTQNYFKRGAQNTTQQMFLLKALKVTQDPKKLKEMLHMRSVAEVYRTLDKLAMRKEYHSALTRCGISFDYILKGIKGIAEGGEKDSDKLSAYKALLKSVGMEDYKDSSTVSKGTWEEVLLKKIEEGKNEETASEKVKIPVYSVIQPVVPESVRKAHEEEKQVTSSIYDKR